MKLIHFTYPAVLTALLLTGTLTQAQVLNPPEKMSLDSTQSLNEVTVRSKYYRQYNPDQSSASLKVRTPLLNLSQNIQVIDASILADQQILDLNEGATRNVSGALRNNTHDFYDPGIFMRGAAINTLRNGVDVSMIYFGPMPEDAALIDRLEFIKGPAGFMNSVGDPAGSFNMVTKQPTGRFANQINLTGGSFNLYRITGDFDGRFDKKGKLLYRLNLVGQKTKSFQNFAFNDKFVIRPVLRYNISPNASLTAEYIYQKQSFQQYFLTVFSPYGFATLPRDFSITDPNKKPEHAQENNGFLTYKQRFSDNWQLTARATYVQDDLDGNYFFVSAYDKNAPSIIKRRVTYERYFTRVFAGQVYLNGQFSTGSLNHQVLVGLDANQKTLLAYSGYNDPKANYTLYPLDVNNPVYGLPFDSNEKTGPLEDIATNKSAVRYLAGYVQDEVNLFQNKLRLTLSARFTSAKSSVDIPTVSSVANQVVTPRAGISYSITRNFSAYALTDNTFTPQAGISATGGLFDPLRGHNVEAGLKKDWNGGKWNTTLSVYRITRDNVIVSDPVTKLQSQIGQTTSKGVEFDLKGELVKGLNAVINYAYTDSYLSKDANEAYVGKPTPYRVRHIQNTWLNYRLPFRNMNGFTISTGYQLQAGRAGRYYQDPPLDLNDLIRVDAGAGWSNARFSVNLLVNNLLNRANYGSAWTRPAGLYTYVLYPPREFRLSLGYTF